MGLGGSRWQMVCASAGPNSPHGGVLTAVTVFERSSRKRGEVFVESSWHAAFAGC
jgi:hypothetical protein